MVPAPVETDEKSAENTKDEIATVLIHLKKLLRLKNWLRSPLLRLPTEIIVQILSYITENRGEWQSVFSTCYHIRAVMNNAAELWQQANFVSDKRALPVSVFARSQGNLQEITADLIVWGDCRDDHARNALRFCRDNLVLHGHKLRALDLRGCPSDIINFSWIFERPLPRLEYLKIHFYPLWLKESGSYIQDPEILQFPADLPLRVLDLSNATPPWSSYLLFTELRELHLDFTECESFVEISEEELLGILEASPRLESLSLIRLLPKAPIVDGERDYNPIRIVKLASLTSLDLDSLAELVGYILVHMDLPVIDSLKIRGEFSPWEVEVFFGYLFPDFLLPERLLTNPPIFEIWPDGGYGIYDSLKVRIGGIHIQFDFDMDDEEEASETIIGCVLPLVPLSVTALRLDHSDLDKGEWAEFFQLHTEVRSITSSSLVDGFRTLLSEPLWDALSPAGADAVTLCPKLESISLPNELISTPLFNCLLNRKSAGYGLKHLALRDVDDRSAEALESLVEELQVVAVPARGVR